MRDSRQKNGQKGIAMIIVVCIMAVLVMMSLALLLAASVMTRSAGCVRSEQQARILAVSLADELEKDITQTSDAQNSGGLLQMVNSQIQSGSWPAGEERSFAMDQSALSAFGQTDDLSTQVTLNWEQGEEEGYADASLSVTVTCTYQEASFSVTTVYTADADDSNEDTDVNLLWIRSQRQ